MNMLGYENIYFYLTIDRTIDKIAAE